jgi:hypothetical protein
MMKKIRLARFVFVCLSFLLMQGQVWAEQQKPAPATNTTQPALSAPAPMTQNVLPAKWVDDPDYERLRIGPNLPEVQWRSLGQEQLIPRGSPWCPEGPEGRDLMWLHKVMNGVKGYERCRDIARQAFYLTRYPGESKPDPAAWEKVVADLNAGMVTIETYTAGTKTETAMAFGGTLENGTFRALVPGRARLHMDVQGWTWPAEQVGSGPYRGSTQSLMIPVECFNVTGVRGLALNFVEPPVVAPMPQPKYAKIKVRNDYNDVKGRNTKAPPREEVQARIEVTPQEGGETIRAEMLNNGSVDIQVEQGKKYTVREILESTKWRFTSQNPAVVTVGERDVEVRFEKMQVPSLTEAVVPPPLQPPPAPVKETIIREKDTKHKKIWTAIGIIAGATALCYVVCGGEELVPGPNLKGGDSPNNPGRPPSGNTGSGTAAVGLRFRLGF